MDAKAKAANRKRYLKAAQRLNHDAGLLPSSYTATGRGKKRRVQFHPCPKAEVYLAALCDDSYRPDALKQPGYADINSNTPGLAVTQRAAMIPCACHPDWGMKELEAVEFS